MIFEFSGDSQNFPSSDIVLHGWKWIHWVIHCCCTIVCESVNDCSKIHIVQWEELCGWRYSLDAAFVSRSDSESWAMCAVAGIWFPDVPLFMLVSGSGESGMFRGASRLVDEFLRSRYWRRVGTQNCLFCQLMVFLFVVSRDFLPTPCFWQSLFKWWTCRCVLEWCIAAKKSWLWTYLCFLLWGSWISAESPVHVISEPFRSACASMFRNLSRILVLHEFWSGRRHFLGFDERVQQIFISIFELATTFRQVQW